MTDRQELEQRCHDLMSEGHEVTSRIEQLLQRAEPMEANQFDRALERLKKQEAEIHGRLEQAMAELQSLD